VGWGKPKAKRQGKAEPNHKGETAHSNGTTAHSRAITRWPTADLPVNSDY